MANNHISYSIEISEGTAQHRDLMFIQALRVIIDANIDLYVFHDDIIAALKNEIRRLEKPIND